VCRRRSVAVAHIGDGAVVVDSQRGLELLSGPGDSEYTNEVEPISSFRWPRNLRRFGPIEHIRRVAVITDGCQRAGLSPRGERPHSGFFEPLLRFASAVTSLSDADSEVARLLAGPKMSEHSDDDKSLAIAVLCDD
jgi:protein phosphatase 2C-like protein